MIYRLFISLATQTTLKVEQVTAVTWFKYIKTYLAASTTLCQIKVNDDFVKVVRFSICLGFIYIAKNECK